jgi:hypothetical protein
MHNGVEMLCMWLKDMADWALGLLWETRVTRLSARVAVGGNADISGTAVATGETVRRVAPG